MSASKRDAAMDGAGPGDPMWPATGRGHAPRAARLDVGVIGTGRVGSVLGAALARAGHRIVAATGVSRESVARASRLLPGVPLLPANDVVARAALVLLAVPDDALPGLVAGLSETSAWRPGQLVVHTSGAHGLDVLAPAARRGALPIALHPVMTFAGRPEDLAKLAGVAYGVTTPDPGLVTPATPGPATPGLRPVAEALVLEMGGEPVWIPDEARPLYHAALVTGANHLVTLVNDAVDLLRAAGVDEAGRVLGPLLGAALDNALRLGNAALTGPVSRGDAGTIAEHLRTLGTYAPGAVPAYVAMARRTADRALACGRLDPRLAEALLDVLATKGASP
ncbi:MAG TPA: DUF2520 domain-containing protein [Mycobacteriales bacterium]|nr:DUF2520 domain-containing protein [Mycobacteriales bacterium]